MKSVECVDAVTSLDGRYRHIVADLGSYVGEGALIRYRMKVEAAWVLKLASSCDVKISAECRSLLESWSKDTRAVEISRVKELEKETNHDVKALEYFMQEKLQPMKDGEAVFPWVHFACTSEDINNLAYGLMLKDVREYILKNKVGDIIQWLKSSSQKYKSTAMLSRTHGQTATPTTLGNELAVFALRLEKAAGRLNANPIEGKLNGATGGFNAHAVAFENVDWINVSKEFVTNLGLTWNPLTTQIETHDSFVTYCQALQNINTICIDIARDFWGYISLGYFKQKLKSGEVGSSTMPHKVNPIDFENAEGNFGVANALSHFYSDKLPISRWQRDLSDSTVLRTFGTFVGHSVVGLSSLAKGLGKVEVSESAIQRDLEEAWEVLGEAVQTVLRKHGVMDAYERIKKATRGEKITQKIMHEIIESCSEIPENERKKLLALTPSTYVGLCARLVDVYIKGATL